MSRKINCFYFLISVENISYSHLCVFTFIFLFILRTLLAHFDKKRLFLTFVHYVRQLMESNMWEFGGAQERGVSVKVGDNRVIRRSVSSFMNLKWKWKHLLQFVNGLDVWINFSTCVILIGFQWTFSLWKLNKCIQMYQ